MNTEINIDAERKNLSIIKALEGIGFTAAWIGIFVFYFCFYKWLGTKEIQPHELFLIFLYVFAFTLVILITFTFIVLMMLKRKEERINEREILTNDLPENYKISIIYLIERKYDYIRNYLIFQVAHKVLGILSVVYSVLGLYTLINKEDLSADGLGMLVTYLIPFSALVCVLITLYVAQPSRISQYLEAWRNCNELILETICNLDDAKRNYKILKDNENAPKDNEMDDDNIEQSLEDGAETDEDLTPTSAHDTGTQPDMESESENSMDEDKIKDAMNFFHTHTAMITDELSRLEYTLSSDSE